MYYTLEERIAMTLQLCGLARPTGNDLLMMHVSPSRNFVFQLRRRPHTHFPYSVRVSLLATDGTLIALDGEGSVFGELAPAVAAFAEALSIA